MVKRLVSVALGLAILVAGQVAARAGVLGYAFDQDSYLVRPGKTVSVPVYLQETGDGDNLVGQGVGRIGLKVQTTGTPPAEGARVSVSGFAANALDDAPVSGFGTFDATLGKSVAPDLASIWLDSGQSAVSGALKPGTSDVYRVLIGNLNLTAGGIVGQTTTFAATRYDPQLDYTFPGSSSPEYSAGAWDATIAASGPTTVDIMIVSVTAGWAPASGPGGGSWNHPGNWSGNDIPSQVGDFATFGTHANVTAPATVNLNGSQSLSQLTFNNTSYRYTIAPGTGGTLTLQGSSGAAVVSVTGNHEINAPVTLGSEVSITTASNSSLTFSETLSGTGRLTKLGPGLLAVAVTATSAYSGTTTVKGGTLEIAGGIGPGGTTLIDVQAGTAVLRTTNVDKPNLDISTATGAGFEVRSGAHALHSIAGSGATTVSSGASLVANSIVQNTLTIGAGGSVTIRETTGEAANVVPEPSTLALLGMGALGLLGFAWRRRKRIIA